MNQNILETVIGAIVLIIAFCCVFLAYQSGSISKTNYNGYTLYAQFTNADGIFVGSKVKISGVQIGEVRAVTYDSKNYKANVTITVSNDTKLPIDSSAAILSSGLLGEKYLGIAPGAETQMLLPQASLQFTQASTNLEELLGKFLFGIASTKSQTNSAS